MLKVESESFLLENFEGPIDMLWHLVIRNEIDIIDIPLIEITKQYLAKAAEKDTDPLERGSDFIATAASLVWFKSKALLPKHEQVEQALEDEENDPRFEIIHHLLDYCRFKDAAKELALREQQQNAFYSRGIEAAEVKKQLGIAHLSLEDLATLFQEILSKAQPRVGIIEEEEWKVSDKIKALRQLLRSGLADFRMVFHAGMGKVELIVTFLALLELMKLGEAKVVQDTNNGSITICGA